jgi:hypothetical protein
VRARPRNRQELQTIADHNGPAVPQISAQKVLLASGVIATSVDDVTAIALAMKSRPAIGSLPGIDAHREKVRSRIQLARKAQIRQRMQKITATKSPDVGVRVAHPEIGLPPRTDRPIPILRRANL